MPRFVILEHDSPRGCHWDFMLEQEESLTTWALPQPPDTVTDMAAEQLPDHRQAYLDYEGPVSGNRGSVRRWDQGQYRLERRTESEWSVVLQGQRLQGQVILQRQSSEATEWRFVRLP